MKFQLEEIDKQLNKYEFQWAILVILLFCSLEFCWEQALTTAFTVMITLVSAMIMFLLNRESEVITQINGVKPIWKIIDGDSRVEYFSLDRGKSFLDNVRYYSIICDNKHNIKSMNAVNNEEIEEFYFTDNAVVESEKIYSLKDSPLLENSENPVFMDLKTYKNDHQTDEHINEYKQLFVFKATTLFGDDTYFFEGDTLSGGICVSKKKYKPYSGNWNGDKDIELAKTYIQKIKERSSH
ncbi:hypothetical protein JK167_07915 [Levilactobacillus brevis]|uniref:Uncharacterized protein n=1 Tax=Levilactobacillus brevis TaxID=1580 RepID=A0AA41EPX7_LEVBR|nr:hypothetical protein [Levilactobacillus brevis]MBS0947605.1 hypothetical protein [Levilactobacillus brevis]MBS1010750.1 hypothetical protein [Levilactobacillus brevis]